MKIAIFGSSSTSSEVGDGIIEPRALEYFCLGLGSVTSRLPACVACREAKALALLIGWSSTACWPHRVAERQEYGYITELSGTLAAPFTEDAKRSDDVFLFIPLPETAWLSPSHLRMLRDADLAIVIGGGANAYAAGLAASLMGVRLIPVATFGGAGRLLWPCGSILGSIQVAIVKFPLRYTWDRLAQGASDSVVEVIRREIAALPRLMIVHGRSSDRVAVEDISACAWGY